MLVLNLMIATGIMLFKWLKENKQSQDIIEDISESISIDENIDNVEKYNIDFEELKQTNADTLLLGLR